MEQFLKSCHFVGHVLSLLSHTAAADGPLRGDNSHRISELAKDWVGRLLYPIRPR